jgi:hypothetical protein
MVRFQSEIRDVVDRERSRRHSRELKKSEELEDAFSSLSSFCYDPVDYTPGLVRKHFTEPAIPDFSYILTEARLKVHNKYQAPIIIQLMLGLFFVLLSLAYQDSFVPIIGAAGLLACAISLHTDLKSRQRKTEEPLNEARAIIDTKVREMKESIDSARKAFDEQEDARTEKIQKLLSGEQSHVFERIEEVLRNIKLPFHLRCTVDLVSLEPMVTLHLPDHAVVPAKTVSLTPSGNIDYNEKSSFEINKQYSEAMAGTAINIAALLYSFVPPLSTIYIQGLFDRWEEAEYLFSMKTTRQSIIDVLESRSALEALRSLGAEHEVKTSGSFTPVEPIFPSWWETVPKDKILSRDVLCQQRF